MSVAVFTVHCHEGVCLTSLEQPAGSTGSQYNDTSYTEAHTHVDIDLGPISVLYGRIIAFYPLIVDELGFSLVSPSARRPLHSYEPRTSSWCRTCET